MRPRNANPTAALRLVVDTNVIVSAALSKVHGREYSPALLIVDLLTPGKQNSPSLLASQAILDEYTAVLQRPRFGLPETLVRESIRRILMSVEMVKPVSRLETADRDDSMFLECALDGLADYLITGNKRYYPDWTIIVTPSEFLDRLTR